MTIKEIRSITGLSQAKFAEKYKIPRRSIENWECDKNNPNYRECPEYVINMLKRIVKEDYKFN